MKTFVQYGAGNIGRGFIGEIFSNANYNILFIDVNMEVVNALNNQQSYPISIVSNKGTKEIIVNNVSGINGIDTENVAIAIANCSLMATAVGVNVLPKIVPNLIAGFRKRIEIGNQKPLNIIICENLIDADKLLYKLITEQLNEKEKEIFNKQVGLVEASIGRMVPIMTEEMKKENILRVCVESYCELPIDKDAFKGEIPRVPHLFPFSPFQFYIKRKLYIHNMGHALTAYLGNLIGCEYIWQAIENPTIKIIVQRAMTESAIALSKKYNIPLQSILEHIEDLLLRFSNIALGDTTQRVGKDIKRKLSANDRFVGAIKMCERQNIAPIYISIGIAAGLFFENIIENGIDQTLHNLCDIKEDKYIKPYYEQLEKEKNHITLLKMAETLKENEFKIKKII